jgi:hypothetical protein
MPTASPNGTSRRPSDPDREKGARFPNRQLLVRKYCWITPDPGVRAWLLRPSRAQPEHLPTGLLPTRGIEAIAAIDDDPGPHLVG